MVIFRSDEAARAPRTPPPARRSRAHPARVVAAASGSVALGLLLSACGSGAGGEPEAVPGMARPAGDDSAEAPDEAEGREQPTDDATSDAPSDADSGSDADSDPGSGSGTGSGTGTDTDTDSDGAPGSDTGSGDSGGPGESDGGDGADPGPYDPCDGTNTETTAGEVARPVNHLLLTVTNTASAPCDLLGYPALRFEGAQAVPPAYESSQPQETVTLEPGESGYAGVTLAAADGSAGNPRTATTLEVFFHDRDGSSDASAIPPLPEEGVSYDDSLTVAYWQQTRDDALAW
ncbi:DUF4232 domain-containing protein [Streptomyces mayteni]